MAEPKSLIAARLPRGFEDRSAADIAATDRMMATIRGVYERYGFDALETPFLEYTETLGKFLPDTDRPNAGVFSLQDDDEQWMSLRYDLTAPLARHFAENYDRLPKPYRSYRAGWVFRNEKPGPGRFRQFMQFDADTVGAAGPEADAEMCMMMADTMDALGLAGKYAVKVNNRKVLDGVLDAAGVKADQKLTVLRAIDKLDKFGAQGVDLLLGKGRKDESGDFTKGAGLGENQRRLVLDFIAGHPPADNPGMQELEMMRGMFAAAGYGADRIRVDPSVVRGLEYYTGPVFEIELTFPVTNEKGEQVVYGAVGGGGRYDGLVSRFRAEPVPATGFSIGVSRLATALKLTGNLDAGETAGPVVVLVLDRDPAAIADYQKMTSELRNAGIRAEMYLGPSGMNAQMKYADRRNAAAAIIVGSNERAEGKVTIKDLVAGAEQARAIKDNAEYKAARPGQWEAPRADLVTELSKIPSIAAMRARR
ncbi:MAG TPA: histidine--tRNA ligase [Devosia sp.]|nr:histidine--tRNA ligase [Devosia sp.]